MSSKVDNAVATITREYLAEVNQWAKDFDDRIAAGEWDDRDDFIESMDQETDGAQRVIYTWRARIGLLVSDNHDAYFDMGYGELDCNDGIPYSLLMLFAFRADILDRMDTDIDDDDVWEDEDDDEDDDY